MRIGHKSRLAGSGPAIFAMLCAGGLTSAALADARGGVDVALGGKVASNPYGDTADGKAELSFSPSIAPWFGYVDGRTTLNGRASVLLDASTGRNGRNVTGTANLDAQQVFSQSFVLSAGADYAISQGNLQNLLLSTVPGVGGQPLPQPGTPLPDVSTAGRRAKTQTIMGRLGASWRIDPINSLNLGLSSILSQSNSAGAQDFVTHSASLGYSRALSARTSGSLSVAVKESDYLRTRENDGTIISPQVGVEHKFNDRLSATASAGASFASFIGVGGIRDKFSVFSGSVQLCNTIEMGNICFSAGRTAQATTISGIGVSTDVSGSIDRRIGRSSSLSLSARFSQSQQAAARLGQPARLKQNFLGASANYSRQLGERLSFFVTPSYSKTSDSIAARGDNFEVRAGISCRFGAMR